MANSLTFSLIGKDVSASKTLKGVGDTASKTGGMFKNMAAVAGGALAAIGISRSLGAVKDFLGSTVAAYKEAQRSQLELTTAYEKFPAVASVSIDALRAYNQELAAKTRFDDDAIASGQAILAQYNLTGEQLRDLTPLVADYAARTGQDFASAAQSVGNALLGQGRSLRAIGIDFQDAGSVAGNLEQIMAGLNSQVGGFAERDGAEGEGMAIRLRNRMGELKEEIGGGLLPIIYKLQGAFLEHIVPILQTVTTAISTGVGPAFDSLVGFIGPVIAQLQSTFGPVLSTLGPQVLQLAMALSPLGLIFKALAPVLPIVGELLLSIATILSGALSQVLPIITDLVARLATVLSDVLGQVLPILAEWWTVLADLLSTVVLPAILQVGGVIADALMTVLEALLPILPMLMKSFLGIASALLPLIEPILGIVVAFLPLIGVIAELAVSLLPVLLELLMAVLDPILALIGPIVTMLVPALEWLAGVISTVIGWIMALLPPILDAAIPALTGIAGAIRGAFTGIAEFVGGVFTNVVSFILGAINTVIDVVNGAIDLVNGLGDGARAISGGTVSWRLDKLPRLRMPALAEGGIVSSATIAMIGEGREPEVVAPLSKLPQVARDAGLGGGGVVLEFHGDAAALAGLFNVHERRADGTRILRQKMGKR